VLPALERRHDVLALTLAGHAGGPKVAGPVTDATLADAVERAMDEQRIGIADFAGNSLGGYVAFQLAARGRARTVTALAPAGGWADGDCSYRDTLRYFVVLLELAREAAPYADEIMTSPEVRRRATENIAENYEHIPAELLAHQLRGAASCEIAQRLIELAELEGWTVDAERIACPVRIVWGTSDKVLPLPAAAAGFRDHLFPHADWVELDGVGHSPQLDVPLETAELILGFSSRNPQASAEPLRPATATPKN
jgi:pimeloyl-ACP methyl ester carboxylesterase